MEENKNREHEVSEHQSVLRPIEQAKKSIKERLIKQEGKLRLKAEPEMAIEVLDEKIQAGRPVEQALATEHLFRKTIEESISVGICVFDMKWKQIYVNQVFCEMVEYAESDLVGHSFPPPYWTPRSEEESAEDQIDGLEKMLQSNHTEIQFKRRRGNPFWGIIFSNRLYDVDGKAIGCLLSITDITALKNAEESLKLVSTKLINTQEKERKLVAQDLHDSIGGKLTGIKYGLEKIISDLGKDEHRIGTALKDIVGTVRSTLEEAQRITRNLRPSILDDLGLPAAIREFCREFQGFFPNIHVNQDVEIKEEDVPESFKILIYRVIQEGMHNVARHSGAENVTLQLRCQNHNIELVIKDDGTGFDLTSIDKLPGRQRGMGLESMRERTQLFGGNFSMNTHPGHGTTVKASWPLNPS